MLASAIFKRRIANHFIEYGEVPDFLTVSKDDYFKLQKEVEDYLVKENKTFTLRKSLADKGIGLMIANVGVKIEGSN